MAYFSNSSEGFVLDEQCCECHIPDDVPCPVLLVQTMYNYDQMKEGNEKLREAINQLIDEKGNCQMKLLLDKHLRPLVDPNQTSLDLEG